MLYEPILRILLARGYLAHCEFPCPGVPRSETGDRKRVDFEASLPDRNVRFALEVKWVKERKPAIAEDRKKLLGFQQSDPNSRSFLCMFGRRSHIEKHTPPTTYFSETGEAVYADLGRTRFGCRIYELRSSVGISRTPSAGRR
jgi:hypothetical protein